MQPLEDLEDAVGVLLLKANAVVSYVKAVTTRSRPRGFSGQGQIGGQPNYARLHNEAVPKQSFQQKGA